MYCTLIPTARRVCVCQTTQGPKHRKNKCIDWSSGRNFFFTWPINEWRILSFLARKFDNLPLTSAVGNSGRFSPFFSIFFARNEIISLSSVSSVVDCTTVVIRYGPDDNWLIHFDVDHAQVTKEGQTEAGDMFVRLSAYLTEWTDLTEFTWLLPHLGMGARGSSNWDKRGKIHILYKMGRFVCFNYFGA